MTKNYIVSGHGGCFKGQQSWLPLGVEVHFYCLKNKVLQNNSGYSILDKLLLDMEIESVWHVEGGQTIPTYSCWAYPGIAPASGVFRRKSGEMVMGFDGTSGSKPIMLTYIIEKLTASRGEKRTIIHWLACTTEATSGSSSVSYQTPERF